MVPDPKSQLPEVQRYQTEVAEDKPQSLVNVAVKEAVDPVTTEASDGCPWTKFFTRSVAALSMGLFELSGQPLVPHDSVHEFPVQAS